MDAITYWNEAVQEADRVTHTTGDRREAGARGPAGSSRAFAIVHLAMHDAYFSIVTPASGKIATYLGALLPAPPAGASDEAAIAAAAHATLSALYPAQKAFFDARLRSLKRQLAKIVYRQLRHDHLERPFIDSGLT